jgi:hypothetical protein
MSKVIMLGVFMRLPSKVFSSEFDPTDPGFQVTEAFPPNKNETWTYAIEQDGWYIAHEALRGEANDFTKALDRFLLHSHRIQDFHLKAMKRWWMGHQKHMDSHHHNEDMIAKKFASQRFHWPDFVDQEHQILLADLSSLDVAIKEFVHTKPAEYTLHLERIKELWDAYHQHVLLHLAREEEVCIGLMRAYFAQHEVTRLQHMLGMKGPRVEMGAIVHYLGGIDATKQVMQQQGLPTILEFIGMEFIAKPRYRFYKKKMLKHLDTMLKL